jgi:hypothetical protein
MNTPTKIIMQNFDKSIIELSKRKVVLMREIKQINDNIEFLQKQRERCIND